MTVHWQDFALCRGVNADLFFPGQGESTREAKAVCVDCPVRQACLEYAIANNERFGIWGGLSRRERERLVTHRQGAVRPINHGTVGGYKNHHLHGSAPCTACRAAYTKAKRDSERRLRLVAS